MKAFNSWAEVEDWNVGREFRRPHKRKSETIAKLDIKKQLEEMENMDSIFIIKEVWTPSDSEYELSEILEGEYSLTKSEAWDKLAILAGNHDVELNQNEYSFYVPTPERGVEENYFYIEELWRG